MPLRCASRSVGRGAAAAVPVGFDHPAQGAVPAPHGERPPGRLIGCAIGDRPLPPETVPAHTPARPCADLAATLSRPPPPSSDPGSAGCRSHAGPYGARSSRVKFPIRICAKRDPPGDRPGSPKKEGGRGGRSLPARGYRLGRRRTLGAGGRPCRQWMGVRRPRIIRKTIGRPQAQRPRLQVVIETPLCGHARPGRSGPTPRSAQRSPRAAKRWVTPRVEPQWSDTYR